MKLYTFDASPNPLKVRLALAEMQLECDQKEVVLFKGEQRKDDFLELNPLGKVPVLEDGDFVLTESNAILCYLAQNYCKELWAKDSKSEARALQWLFYEAMHIAPFFGTVWFNKFGMPKVGGESQPLEKIQDKVDVAEGALDHLEDWLTDNDFMLGEDFSVVDCSIGVQVASLKETMLKDEKVWPAVSDYLKRITSRPSWKEARGSAIWDD